MSMDALVAALLHNTIGDHKVTEGICKQFPQKHQQNTINAIRSSCADKVNIEYIDGRIELPLPYMIANEIRDVFKMATLAI